MKFFFFSAQVNKAMAHGLQSAHDNIFSIKRAMHLFEGAIPDNFIIISFQEITSNQYLALYSEMTGTVMRQETLELIDGKGMIIN